MEFDKSFFEQEERCGFVISSKMKRAWAAQMQVIEDIDRVCKMHGLTWYAGFGTLLGAVRHHGFIPWDDDTDIFMKRKDYDLFWQVAAKDMPPVYIAYNMHTEKIREICYYMRVISGQETRFDDEYIKMFHGFPYVAGVDIFPIDAYPPEGPERDIQRQLLTACQKLRPLTYGKKVTDPGIEESVRFIEDMCNVSLPRDEELAWELEKLQEKLVTSYSEDEDCITELGIVPTGWPPVSKESFEKVIDMPFEHVTIPVPVGYDEVLRALYGDDYMTPIQRVSHEYPFYAKQERHFCDVHGFVPNF